MKTLPITIPSETKVSPGDKPLNEVQRQLKGILDYWGSVGERWIAGTLEEGDKRCAIGQLNYICVGKVESGDCAAPQPAWRRMREAAVEMGFSLVSECNNSGFPNAKRMVERAIELAADAP